MVPEPASAPVAAASTTIDIRLLGGFEVRVDGEPIEALRSGRARSLVAFLILHADLGVVASPATP